MTSDHWSRRHVGHVGEDADAGVVDQDVETAEPRDRRARPRARPRRSANVGRSVSTAAGPAPSIVRVAPPTRCGVAAAGDRHVTPSADERARDRQADAARSAGDDRHLDREAVRPAIAAITIAHGCRTSPSSAPASLAARSRTCSRGATSSRSIRLIDERRRVAAGKALDIMQAAPIEGFATAVVRRRRMSRRPPARRSSSSPIARRPANGRARKGCCC